MGVPVLVQPKWLRSFGAGQVDYSFIYQQQIYVVEAKTTRRISKKQILRLRTSTLLLGETLQIRARLVLYVEKDGYIYNL
jgi:hypothetical protein